MINELIKLATHLDNKGAHKEADYLDAIIKQAKNQQGDKFSLGDFFTQVNDTKKVHGWSVGVGSMNIYSKREAKKIIKKLKSGNYIAQTNSSLANKISGMIGGLGLESAPKGSQMRFLLKADGTVVNNSGTAMDIYAKKVLPNIERALVSFDLTGDKLNIHMLKQTEPK